MKSLHVRGACFAYPITLPASKCAHDCRQMLLHGMPDGVQTAETVHPLGHEQMDHPLWKMSAVLLSP